MKIKWFGHSCFMITSKEGKKIIVDPYVNMLGYKLPELEADIVTTSHEHKDHNNIDAVKGNFVHINGLGVFSEHGIELKGIDTFHDKVSGTKKGKNTIFNIKVDDINICHCGDLGHILDANQVDQIGDVDVLLIPVGGGYTIDAADAVEVVKQLKPKVIVPMHYRTKALGPAGLVFAKVDKFIDASGLKAQSYGELELNKENIENYQGIAVLKYK